MCVPPLELLGGDVWTTHARTHTHTYVRARWELGEKEDIEKGIITRTRFKFVCECMFVWIYGRACECVFVGAFDYVYVLRECGQILFIVFPGEMAHRSLPFAN